MQATIKGFSRASDICRSFSVVLLIAALLSMPMRVMAQETEVGATLCDNQPPIINISSPTSGDTLSSSTVAIAGTVDRASQLIVLVNSVVIATQNTSFTAPFSVEVPLVEGSNTISVEAHLDCNGTTSAVPIVVQYIPPPTPPQPVPIPAAGGVDSRIENNKSIVSRVGSFIKDIQNNLQGGGHEAEGGNNEGGKVTTKMPVSYVILVRSWLSLLLSIIFLAFVLLPRRIYRQSSIFKNLKVRTVYIRAGALILFVIFMFVLQL